MISIQSLKISELLLDIWFQYQLLRSATKSDSAKLSSWNLWDLEMSSGDRANEFLRFSPSLKSLAKSPGIRTSVSETYHDQYKLFENCVTILSRIMIRQKCTRFYIMKNINNHSPNPRHLCLQPQALLHCHQVCLQRWTKCNYVFKILILLKCTRVYIMTNLNWL